MSATRKKDGPKRSGQNKAQLLRELSELKVRVTEREQEVVDCQEQLEDARSKLSNAAEASPPTAAEVVEPEGGGAGLEEVEPESNHLAQEVTALRDESARLRQENEVLRKRLQVEQEKALKENEAAKRLQREAERQQLHLKSRIQELEKKAVHPVVAAQNAVSDGRESVETPARQETPDRQPASSDTPEVSIKPGGDSSPPGSTATATKPVHSEAAASVQSVLAQEKTVKNRDHRRDHHRAADAARRSRVAAGASKVLQQIRLQQSRRTLDPGKPVAARQPFSVRTHLHFPMTPTTDQLDVDSSTFDIHVVVADASGKTIINRGGVAEVLAAGISDYDSSIPMAGLDAGKYLLEIYALSRFADTEECQRVELTAAD